MAPASSDLLPPAEVARQTIRTLAARKLQPTPENYSRVYREMAGETAVDGMAERVERLRRRLATAAADRQPDAEIHRALLEALDTGDARRLELAIKAATQHAERSADAQHDWPYLLRQIAEGLCAEHADLSREGKFLELERSLAHHANDSTALERALRATAERWRKATRVSLPAKQSAPIWSEGKRWSAKLAAEHIDTLVESEGETATLLREVISTTLEFAVIERLGHSRTLRAKALQIADAFRGAAAPKQVSEAANSLKYFWVQLELAGESTSELTQTLVRLVGLMLESSAELVDDGRWVKGQLESVRKLLEGDFSLRRVKELERRLRDVVISQSRIKHEIDQARDAFKSLMEDFARQLSNMADSTGSYQDRLHQHTTTIRNATTLAEINPVVRAMIDETGTMRSEIAKSRELLTQSESQVRSYEGRVRELERDLSAANELLREDPLTHALNRRGLDDAFAIEFARADRKRTPLSVAVLDVDNFKRLNDHLGHIGGDQALVHLAYVVRKALRPTDVLARFGGEEFVILMPDTPVDKAVLAVTRLQRELTKQFFLFNQERVFITFSAGVAQYEHGDAQEELLQRADAALMEAKVRGKNRVVSVAELAA